MKYETEYLNILNEELKKAMGCTEPIAISYLGCTLRDLLGEIPRIVNVYVSGNILKKVKSVVVTNSGWLCGIKAATALGIIAGKNELKLECISKATVEDKIKMQEYLKNTEIKILSSEDGFVFDIQIVMFGENGVYEGRIKDKYRLILILIRECASVGYQEKHHRYKYYIYQ